MAFRLCAAPIGYEGFIYYLMWPLFMATIGLWNVSVLLLSKRKQHSVCFSFHLSFAPYKLPPFIVGIMSSSVVVLCGSWLITALRDPMTVKWKYRDLILKIQLVLWYEFSSGELTPTSIELESKLK